MLLDILEHHGLLLLSDARRPAVAQLVAGEPIRGSWWAHPMGDTIFAAANTLEEHPDVLVAKVIDEKVTFVHRRLWPAFLGAARARAPWQMAALSPDATALLDRLDATDVSGHPALAEIEVRWLAEVRQEHTPSGRHVRRGRSWARWAAATDTTPLGYDEGVLVLRTAVSAFGGGRLPIR